jgi:hypothetical protein
MRNDAFPAPPSPINTALSSCIRGGGFFGRERVVLKERRGIGRTGGVFGTRERAGKLKEGESF